MSRNILIKKLSLIIFFQAVLAVNLFLPVYSHDGEDHGDASEIGIDLSLSPPALNLTTQPGTSVSSKFTVTNNNPFHEDLQITVSKFQAADGGERPLISDMTEADIHRDWVVFEESEFTVDANQSKEVEFTITPPEDASLGYYYAFIINRAVQQDSQDGGAVIAGAPAILTLLDVETENTVRKLEVTKFETDAMFYEYLPATFKVTVKNTGNIHAAPVGDVFVDSMRSKDVAALRLNEGRANILPQTERSFEAVWDDGFAVNIPKVDAAGTPLKNDKGEIQYETRYDFAQANKFRFGKYTANLLLAYNDGEKDVPLQATVSFWVIPWKIVGGAAFILLFALIGLRNTIFPPIVRVFRKGKK